MYVGKAKNLRARVRSYFKKNQELSLAKQEMVLRIADMRIMPTRTENEALILEAMQIKKNKPPYNVILKDDKDYSFVKIDYTPEYPTVAVVRRPSLSVAAKRKIKLFGPFTSSYALRENLRMLRRIFPYRKKVKILTEFENNLLEKRSIGPVPQTREEYLDMIKRLEKIIDGRTSKVKKELKTRMRKLSKEKKYERAAKVRDQIEWLDIFSTRQKIVTAKQYLQQDIPEYNMIENALSDLKQKLKLKNIPKRIEGYDISNIQGQFSVGAMVVFTNGRPDKNEYRKFKIKTLLRQGFGGQAVEKPNDFASLAEVLKRRFKHDGWQTPDLIMLDGGKGQLSAVIKTLFNKKLLETCDLKLATSQFIALAKREEEVFQGKALKKIKLDSKSDASHLLQRIRDEAHRFAQKYYHTLHSRSIKRSK